MDIKVNNAGNYPVVDGAGLLGDIVNKRWSETWVHSSHPHFPGFDEMALDILIEDYNNRHASDLSNEPPTPAKASPKPAPQEDKETAL